MTVNTQQLQTLKKLHFLKFYISHENDPQNFRRIFSFPASGFIINLKLLDHLGLKTAPGNDSVDNFKQDLILY